MVVLDPPSPRPSEDERIWFGWSGESVRPGPQARQASRVDGMGDQIKAGSVGELGKRPLKKARAQMGHF
jgi:hypothetical protein